MHQKIGSYLLTIPEKVELIKLNNISELQKLNTILKINDITLINFNKNKNLKLALFIKKNINYEKKIIRKYAKKFINSSS